MLVANLVTLDYAQRNYTAHGRRFAVRRLVGHRPAVYHLRDLDITERSRFGTRAQIEADVAYTLENGHLPPAGPRW